jgi:geranylgeranyl diphosphate synthase, type I
MEQFAPSLDELRSTIDAELSAFLDERKAALPEGGLLLDEVERLIRAGGKRLRPSFCYWGARAAGADHSDVIVRAASSLELLHTFAIVHDDIMDRSDERRGEPTVHVKHGNEVALLVGDLALVLADELFFSSGSQPEVLQRAFAAYSRMRQEVIVGQYLDVDASDKPDVDVALARRIAVLKSGRYSVQEPLLIGAHLAGASDTLLADLSKFGEPVGEAFQLRDDLLGLFGERSSIGKSVDSDIREGKRHLLYAFTRELLEGPDREFFLARWGAGADLDLGEVERLRQLVDGSGAKERAEVHLATLRDRSGAVLEAMDIPREAKDALRMLSARATHRST